MSSMGPPLLTYHRRPRPTTDADHVPGGSSSLSDDPLASVPHIDDLPIIKRKGKRSTTILYSVYNYLRYDRLSPNYSAFVSSLSSVPIPKTAGEALSHPCWRQGMHDEMEALQANGTWELVSLPPGKMVVGCRWIFTPKVGPDGKIDRLKIHLVAKGYTDFWPRL